MNALVNQAFSAPVSGVFQGLEASDDLSGGITGGYGMLRIRGKVFAIHYQQNEQQLMRPDGDGPMGSVDIVLLKANKHLSKTWYENGWDENSSNPPDCASANGVVPDAGVPKKQSIACANCPRNQWGTAPNGGKGKACGDHRRLAFVPLADIPNETYGGPMLLRCPAASLSDLAAFDAKYKAAGYPYFALGIKVSFDPKESYPKLVFSALRPLTDDEARLVIAMRNSDAVSRVIGDVDTPVAPMNPEAPPQDQMFLNAPNNAPVASAVATSVPPATVQAQTPPTQPVPQPAAAPQSEQVKHTGFGAVAGNPSPAPVQAAPPVQPAPQPAPVAVQQGTQRPAMTGFGGAAVATPPGNPAPAPVQAAPPVQQVTPPAPQPAPVAVTSDAFAASLDDALAALIGTGAAPAGPQT